MFKADMLGKDGKCLERTAGVETQNSGILETWIDLLLNAGNGRLWIMCGFIKDVLGIMFGTVVD